jgi:hypothetical protein
MKTLLFFMTRIVFLALVFAPLYLPETIGNGGSLLYAFNYVLWAWVLISLAMHLAMVGATTPAQDLKIGLVLYGKPAWLRTTQWVISSVCLFFALLGLTMFGREWLATLHLFCFVLSGVAAINSYEIAKKHMESD